MCYSNVEIYMECFLGFLLQEKLRTFKSKWIDKQKMQSQNPSSKSGAVSGFEVLMQDC